MLLKFELEVLLMATYNKLFMFKCNLDLLLQLQTGLKEGAEARNDTEMIFNTTELIKVIKRNQVLIKEAMTIKENEVLLKSDISTICLN